MHVGETHRPRWSLQKEILTYRLLLEALHSNPRARTPRNQRNSTNTIEAESLSVRSKKPCLVSQAKETYGRCEQVPTCNRRQSLQSRRKPYRIGTRFSSLARKQSRTLCEHRDSWLHGIVHDAHALSWFQIRYAARINFVDCDNRCVHSRGNELQKHDLIRVQER